MTDKENVQVISDAYAAFVRGDIPAILNILAPEIDWHVPGPAEAPYAGRRSFGSRWYPVRYRWQHLGGRASRSAGDRAFG